MSKKRKIILTVLYAWFAASSLFCFLLDLFMSCAMPQRNDPINIDTVMTNQIVYLTGWMNFLVLFWGLLNLIALYVKAMPKWIGSKNNRTFVTAMSISMFIVYVFSLISGSIGATDGVIGFDSWYKITKSSIEHLFNPVILTCAYFVLADRVVAQKKYVLGDAWYLLVFVSAYIIIMLIREACLRDPNLNPDFDINNTNDNGVWNPWPYPGVDPMKDSPAMWIPGLLAIEFIPYGIECLFNYCSNKSYLSMKKRYPNF